MGMLKERKKELLLGAILVAIAVVVWQNLAGGGVPVGAGPSPGGPVPRVNLDVAKIFPVDWASMSARRPSYDPNGRNIFTYGAIPVPTPPPLTPQEKEAIEKARQAAEAERLRQEQLAQQAQAAAAAQAQAAAAAQANQPPPPPPKPQPPPINYKFIGYVGPSENKIAILHDGSDLIFVRAGEKIGGQFRILEIGYESIKFGYTDPMFKGETTTLPMSSSY